MFRRSFLGGLLGLVGAAPAVAVARKVEPKPPSSDLTCLRVHDWPISLQCSRRCMVGDAIYLDDNGCCRPATNRERPLGVALKSGAKHEFIPVKIPGYIRTA
jgi:hypothetical protein